MTCNYYLQTHSYLEQAKYLYNNKQLGKKMIGCNRGVVGDTMITMWDLSQKPISEIEAGDEFLAYDESNPERLNERPRTISTSGDFDVNGEVDPNWLPGIGFDNSHTGYNEHRKGVVKEIQKSQVSKLIKVTWVTEPNETIGTYEDFSVTMTPNMLVQMSHDKGFECGEACPHVSWKTYDVEFNEIVKPQLNKLIVGDLGYRTPNEYEPLPKEFYGEPDYLDEMVIDSIEEFDDDLEFTFEVYHITEAENATMMFGNNTLLHVGLN